MKNSYKANDYPMDIGYIIKLAIENSKSVWESDFADNMLQNWEMYGDKMFLSEKQALTLCNIADTLYEPPKQQKQQQHFKPKETINETKIKLEDSLIKRLIMLCHPDKHSQSEMSIKVTQELLKLRG